MPLIVLTGLPCSGKTRRAHELKALLRKRSRGEVEKTRTMGDRGVLEREQGGRGADGAANAKSSFKKKTNDETRSNGHYASGTNGTLEASLDALKLDASLSATPSPTQTQTEPNENTWTVEIINDESIGSNRAESYKSALLFPHPRLHHLNF